MSTQRKGPSPNHNYEHNRDPSQFQPFRRNAAPSPSSDAVWDDLQCAAAEAGIGTLESKSVPPWRQRPTNERPRSAGGREQNREKSGCTADHRRWRPRRRQRRRFGRRLTVALRMNEVPYASSPPVDRRILPTRPEDIRHRILGTCDPTALDMLPVTTTTHLLASTLLTAVAPLPLRLGASVGRPERVDGGRLRVSRSPERGSFGIPLRHGRSRLGLGRLLVPQAAFERKPILRAPSRYTAPTFVQKPATRARFGANFWTAFAPEVGP